LASSDGETNKINGEISKGRVKSPDISE